MASSHSMSLMCRLPRSGSFPYDMDADGASIEGSQTVAVVVGAERFARSPGGVTIALEPPPDISRAQWTGQPIARGCCAGIDVRAEGHRREIERAMRIPSYDDLTPSIPDIAARETFEQVRNFCRRLNRRRIVESAHTRPTRPRSMRVSDRGASRQTESPI